MPTTALHRQLSALLLIALATAVSLAASEEASRLSAPLAPEDRPLLHHACDPGDMLAAPEPARRKKAAELAQVMDLPRILRAEAELGYAVILHPLRLFVEREMDDDLIRLMQPFFVETRRSLGDGVYWNVVLERSIDAYARAFDETELDAIKTFYASPAGKRLSAAFPELHRRRTELIKISLRDAAEQVRVDFGRALESARVKLLQEKRTASGVVEGRPLPPFSAPDLDGKPVTSRSLRGRVVLLQSWSTNILGWEDDLAKLRDLHNRFHALGLEIVGVNLDIEDEAATRSAFLARNPMPWPNLVGGYGEGASMVSALTLYRPGTRLLVGRDGLLLAIEPALDQLPSLIEKALATPLPEASVREPAR